MRYLPAVIEIALGAIVACVYWILLADKLPREIDLGVTVLPTRWVAAVIVVVCLGMVGKPIHSTILAWLTDRGWLENKPSSS